MASSPGTCPLPFLPVSLGADLQEMLVKRSICYRGCCLPCPAGKIMYPSVYGLFNVFNIIETVSLCTLIFLIISYMILPRSHTLTSPVAAAQLMGLLFVQLGPLFIIGQDPAKTLCSNAITQATQYTNARCAVQGFFLVFGSWTSVLTMFSRLLQLHLQVVWFHNPASFRHMNTKVAAMIIVPYLIALIIGLSALFLGEINFSVAQRCGPDAATSSILLWWPLNVVGVLCFVLHCWTCFKIIKVYRLQRASNRRHGAYASGASDEDESDVELELPVKKTTRIRQAIVARSRNASPCEIRGSPKPSLNGFWRMPSPTFDVDLDDRQPTAINDIKPSTKFGPPRSYEPKNASSNFDKHLYEIKEDEAEAPVSTMESASTTKLTSQQLRQQQQVLSKIRPQRTKEERRNSLLMKLWVLNWRGAKMTLIGTLVLWLYSINSLIAIQHQHYVNAHPDLLIAWAQCVPVHGTENCEHLAHNVQAIWRQLLIDGARAFLGLSIAINEVSRPQYAERVREMWRWRNT